MYTISLVDGRTVAIFAQHVAAVEQYAGGGSVVQMVGGAKYQSTMRMEEIVTAVVKLMRDLNR